MYVEHPYKGLTEIKSRNLNFLRMSSQALVKLKKILKCMSYTKTSHHLFGEKGKLNVPRIAKENGSQLLANENALITSSIQNNDRLQVR